MKIGLYIFLLAFCLRLVNLVLLDLNFENFLYEDQKMYWFGSHAYPFNFWLDSSALVSERMPGSFWYYKILIYFFGNNLFLLLSFQALLDSATCVVISKSAKLVDKSLEKIVGFLAVVSPTMIITSSQILSDTLFLLFFSITLYYFLFTFYKKSFFSLFSAGLMLGLSTFIRAATYPLIFLTLPVAYILNFRWAYKRKILFCILGFFIISLLPLSPRIANNVINHNTLALTSQTGAHLSHWFVPGVLYVSRGYDREKALEFINEKISLYGEADYDYYENSKIKTKVALNILSEEGYFNIVFALGKSAIINIFSPALLVDQRVRNLPHPSYVNSKSLSNWFEVLRTTKEFHEYFVIFLLSIVLATICSFFTVFGFCLFIYRQFYLTLLGSGLIAYFIVITGPNVSPKYILPFIPLIFLWQAAALKQIGKILSEILPNNKFIK